MDCMQYEWMYLHVYVYIYIYIYITYIYIYITRSTIIYSNTAMPWMTIPPEAMGGNQPAMEAKARQLTVD